MAHHIDIRFRHAVAQDDEHKVRNFIEDVWVSAWRQGWVELSELDKHVNSMKDFGFTFPARQSHDAVTMLDRLVRDHFMESFVEVIHLKKAQRG